MKSKILFIAASLFFTVIIWTACKKDNSSGSDSNSTDIATQSAAQASDESIATNEIDNANNDVNATVEVAPSLTGYSVSTPYQGSIATNAVVSVDSSSGNNSIHFPSICGASISYDTSNGNRNVSITYNGTSCNGKRSRSGVITYSIPIGTKWKNAGAAITVNFQNYKVTRLVDNKSITINGSETYTNVSGGLLINLATLKTITHTITSSGLKVVFADSTGTTQQRSWQIAKQRVFTYDNGIVITTTGTYSANGISGIAEWGINRNGDNFTTAITQPMVVRQDCDFRITAGQVQHTLPKVTITATFGLDAAGNATSCPGTGYYYMKTVWQYANKSYTVIKPY